MLSLRHGVKVAHRMWGGQFIKDRLGSHGSVRCGAMKGPRGKSPIGR